MSSPRTPIATEQPNLPHRQATSFTRPYVLTRKPVSSPKFSSSTESPIIISSEISSTSLPPLSPQSTDAPTPLSAARTSLDDIHDAAVQKRLEKKLLNAISTADEAQVWEALAEGADIQAETNKPLITAVNYGAPNIVQILLDEGVKVNALDENEQTPIHLAVTKTNFVVTKMLVEHGAYIDIFTKGKTPLHEACLKGNTVLVKYLLQNGADKEAKSITNFRTPLHFAAWNGKAEAVEILLDAGCNIEAESSEKRTPLYFACCAESPWDYECAKILIARGANLEARRSVKAGPDDWMQPLGDGDTSLHTAAGFDSVKVVELLVEKGADVCARNTAGETALDKAARWKNSKAITALPAASRSTKTKRVTNVVGEMATDARVSISKLFSK